MTKNELANQIVDAAFRVHTSLGPGLLESACEAVPAYHLEKLLRTVRQHAVSIGYQDIRKEIGFRPDLMVEDKLMWNQTGRDRSARAQDSMLRSSRAASGRFLR